MKIILKLHDYFRFFMWFFMTPLWFFNFFSTYFFQIYIHYDSILLLEVPMFLMMLFIGFAAGLVPILFIVFYETYFDRLFRCVSE